MRADPELLRHRAAHARAVADWMDQAPPRVWRLAKEFAAFCGTSKAGGDFFSTVHFLVEHGLIDVNQPEAATAAHRELVKRLWIAVNGSGTGFEDYVGTFGLHSAEEALLGMTRGAFTTIRETRSGGRFGEPL